jgi:hypothetical protein
MMQNEELKELADFTADIWNNEGKEDAPSVNEIAPAFSSLVPDDYETMLKNNKQEYLERSPGAMLRDVRAAGLKTENEGKVADSGYLNVFPNHIYSRLANDKEGMLEVMRNLDGNSLQEVLELNAKNGELISQFNENQSKITNLLASTSRPRIEYKTKEKKDD